MIDEITTYFLDVAAMLTSMPFNVSEKFFVVNVATFVALAYLSWRLYERRDARREKRSRRKRRPSAAPEPAFAFWRFVFPARIYSHPSAKVDYGIFLINILLSPLLLVSAALQAWVSSQVGGALVALNDGQPIVVGDWGPVTYAIFILGYTMAADLAVYVVHRLHHESDVLWPLHALHHSAEVLTPVTLFRKHPVWNVISRVVNLVFTGLFQGVFVFIFFGVPSLELLFGLNTLYVFYNFFGANLRHSHIWLSWGKTLSHVFISPAMHQIHHDPTRMRRNYGEIFALWDWAFGTLYIPEQRERFEIGLPGHENPHDSIAKAYYVPLVECGRALARKLRPSGQG